MTWRWWLAGAAAAGLTVCAVRRCGYSYAGKVVLITGGSRGLGLVMARQLVDAGAAVVLMARDADELHRAADSLDAPDSVWTVTGDVRSSDDADRAVREVLERFGALDVLINNAGVIVSAPLADTALSDFSDLFDVHVMGTLHMSRAALPALTRPGGRIVNICSIGGRIPVPHLAAYCASKFAQAGLSAVMAEEWREHGVTVCTVLPGLMRTGSHVRARFRGDAAREYRLFALAAGLPGTSMSADRAARQILARVRRGHAEIIVPWTVRQAATAHALTPRLSNRVLSLVNRALPDADGAWPDSGMPAARGADLPLPRVVRALTVLNERAAARNNER